MPPDTTAGASPIFLSKPYINSDAERANNLIATSQQLLVHRIYQMDPTAYWQGSLAGGDTVTETIISGLYQGSLLVSRSLDAFVLLNINFKNFLIEYSNDNGTTWATVPGANYQVGVADFAAADFVLFLAAPVTANRVRISMYRTQVANQFKKLGNFYLGLVTFQPAQPFDFGELRPRAMEMRRDVMLADGTIDYTYFKWSDNSFTLFDFEAAHSHVTEAEKLSFDAIHNNTDPFTFYAEPGDIKRSLFVCTFRPQTYSPVYLSPYKGAGYQLRYTLQQVGYV